MPILILSNTSACHSDYVLVAELFVIDFPLPFFSLHLFTSPLFKTLKVVHPKINSFIMHSPSCSKPIFFPNDLDSKLLCYMIAMCEEQIVCLSDFCSVSSALLCKIMRGSGI